MAQDNVSCAGCRRFPPPLLSRANLGATDLVSLDELATPPFHVCSKTASVLTRLLWSATPECCQQRSFCSVPMGARNAMPAVTVRRDKGADLAAHPRLARQRLRLCICLGGPAQARVLGASVCCFPTRPFPMYVCTCTLYVYVCAWGSGPGPRALESRRSHERCGSVLSLYRATCYLGYSSTIRTLSTTRTRRLLKPYLHRGRPSTR